MSDPALKDHGYIECPNCGGLKYTLLFMKQQENFVRCDQCDLVMINPPPSIPAMEATYDTEYSEHYIRKSEKKLKRCRRWVQRIKRRYVKEGRWLDVGCSAGFVVKAASEAGFDAYGVEIEAGAVDYARNALRLENVATGTLQSQNYTTDMFNVITLYDVIEHVPDLNALLLELHRICAPGGVIEIRTPDVAHFATPADLSQWKEVKPSEHLYYFSTKTLTGLFEKHGFSVAHRRFMFKPALNIVFAKHALARPGITES